eukprot:TRINITY_DN5594_c0_g1_i1.p1 TRINITY_DN5594_c0_g1~~TRINITY_DN5594_c0_g1_i1.p1  ORF type:complete len:583 (+),score=286.93 TRINITY_DN5594_c0_g1_i1:68-1750(+)
MDETYAGQHILITGSTGFVGKVFVEKILRSLPRVEKLYLLIRPKKGVETQKRLEAELFESPVMGRLKEQYGEENFKKIFREKVVAVEGSLTDDRLGMTEEVYQTLVDNCTMIFHLAATIDFNEKLHTSAILNVLGSLQILSLARKCHQKGGFEAFIHISTCYCNYQRRGDIVEETLYPLPFEAEAMTKQILNSNPVQLEKDTPALLQKFGFPNTYTMTKSISEHLLNLNKGNVPMAIVRPSIIGSALEEPVPGWVDTLSASGALFVTAGFGIVQEVHADPSCKADIVPVDYVVKGILLAGAKIARESKMEDSASQHRGGVAKEVTAAAPVSPSLPLTEGNLQKASAVPTRPNFAGMPDEGRSVVSSVVTSGAVDRAGKMVPVYQICTSGTDNPLTWGNVVTSVRGHWESNPPKNQVRKCEVVLIANRAEYEGKFHLKRKLPAQLYYAQSRLPFPGARPTAAKNADKLKKATGKAYNLVSQFRAFNNFSWDFMPTNTNSLQDILSPSEAADWHTDVHHISWHVYLANYCYGIMRWVIKEEGIEEPHSNHMSGSRLYARANL